MELFSQYVGEADLEQLMSLYEPEATFSPTPETVVNGLDAIRAKLAEMLMLKPKIAKQRNQCPVSQWHCPCYQ